MNRIIIRVVGVILLLPSVAAIASEHTNRHGYIVNQYVSLEGGYLVFPKAGVRINNTSLGATDMNVAYADIRTSYPITSKISVFATAGYSAMFQSLGTEDTALNQKIVNQSHTNYNPLAGAGVECYATPKLGLNLQYTAFIGANSKVGYPTTQVAAAGLSVHF